MNHSIGRDQRSDFLLWRNVQTLIVRSLLLLLDIRNGILVWLFKFWFGTQFQIDLLRRLQVDYKQTGFLVSQLLSSPKIPVIIKEIQNL